MTATQLIGAAAAAVVLAMFGTWIVNEIRARFKAKPPYDPAATVKAAREALPPPAKPSPPEVPVDHTVFNMPATALKEYLLLRGAATFKPLPFYSKLGDFLTVFWKDEIAYAEKVAPSVYVYRSTITKEIVGFKIEGVKEVLAEGELKPEVQPAPPQ